MYSFRKLPLGSRGISHILLPLTLAVLVIGGSLFVLNKLRTSDQLESSSLSTNVATAASRRRYYYHRISTAQAHRYAKVAYQYWGSRYRMCGRNGSKIKIQYYNGAIHHSNIGDLYDNVDILNDITRDALAYTYFEDPACTIYVNEASYQAYMSKGVNFSTSRSMCFTIVHESGHLLARRPDIGYGQEKHRTIAAPDFIMSYYWIDRMDAKVVRTQGPAYCQRLR